MMFHRMSRSTVKIAVDQPISQCDDLAATGCEESNLVSLDRRDAASSSQFDKSLEGCRQHSVILEMGP